MPQYTTICLYRWSLSAFRRVPTNSLQSYNDTTRVSTRFYSHEFSPFTSRFRTLNESISADQQARLRLSRARPPRPSSLTPICTQQVAAVVLPTHVYMLSPKRSATRRPKKKRKQLQKHNMEHTNNSNTMNERNARHKRELVANVLRRPSGRSGLVL